MGLALAPICARAMDLKQSKFTQIVNEVQVISGSDKSARAAAVDDLFKTPDILRTGPNSRAELVAEDQTITRVGANTVFSFDSANRTIDLEKGSLLFHSPKGRGGGTVRTGSATASVLGTTIVVTTTASGGFKVLILEGFAEVKFLNGIRQHLDAGQMVFVLPGGGMSPIIVFRLDQNIKSSQLVNGFQNPLPSLTKIQDGVGKQTAMIQKGKAVDTGLLVGDNATPTQVQAVDASTIQSFVGSQTAYQPKLVGKAYQTIDGFLVQPASATEPLIDARAPAAALSLDVDVRKSNLDAAHTFVATGPFDVTLPGNVAVNNFLQNPFGGFFGRNISIDTASIDMSPFATVSSFDFLAAKNLNINGSLNFDGFVDFLSLTAGGQIAIAPNAVISANTYEFYLNSPGSVDFNNVTLNSAPGGIQIATLGNLLLNGGKINSAFDVRLSGANGVQVNGTQINSAVDMVSVYSSSAGVGATPAVSFVNAVVNAPAGFNVNAPGDILFNSSTINSIGDYGYVVLDSVDGSVSLNGGSLTSDNGGTVSESGGVGIKAANLNSAQIFAGANVNVAGTDIAADSFSATAGGSVNIGGGGTIAARTVILNAGDGILLDNVTMNGGGSSSSSASFRATASTSAINVGSADHGVDLSSYASVNMSAHTLNLLNVAFGGGSTVNLSSYNGLLAPSPNTGQASLPGYVNFINGVTYGGAPAQNYINNGIYLSASGH